MEKNPRSFTPWRSPPWSVRTACTTISSQSPDLPHSRLPPFLRQSAAAEPTLPIESMKESESVELEPSVSVAIAAEAERAATMPVEPREAPTVLQEGLLGRKHDVEGSGKKSSNRSDSANHSCSLAHSTPQVPDHTVPCLLFSAQVLEQPILRLETGSALGLQGRQELRPRRHLSRRGAPEPRQRQLGAPHQLQEEEARLQTAVSVHVYRTVLTGMQLSGAAGGWLFSPSTRSRRVLFRLQAWRRQRIFVPVQR